MKDGFEQLLQFRAVAERIAHALIALGERRQGLEPALSAARIWNEQERALLVRGRARVRKIDLCTLRKLSAAISRCERKARGAMRRRAGSCRTSATVAVVALGATVFEAALLPTVREVYRPTGAPARWSPRRSGQRRCADTALAKKNLARALDAAAHPSESRPRERGFSENGHHRSVLRRNSVARSGWRLNTRGATVVRCN